MVKGKGMAFLEINPRYRDFLERQRLVEIESFLALPAVIVSGHPDRQVGQVELGHGCETVRAYLKREHRIPWKSRLTNAWAGFGFVSNSRRSWGWRMAAICRFSSATWRSIPISLRRSLICSGWSAWTASSGT